MVVKGSSGVSANPDKTLSVLVHILGIVAGFLPALIIFLIAKDDFTKNNSRNALNWQISMAIYFVVSFILMIVLIGFLLIFALCLLNLIFSIVASVKANEMVAWKYPLSIPFIN